MSFTIHGIDQELDRRLTERARRERLSKNQLVKQLLARAMGFPRIDRDNDEYREFMGKWSDEQRQDFDRRQSNNQHIDHEQWQ